MTYVIDVFLSLEKKFPCCAPNNFLHRLQFAFGPFLLGERVRPLGVLTLSWNRPIVTRMGVYAAYCSHHYRSNLASQPELMKIISNTVSAFYLTYFSEVVEHSAMEHSEPRKNIEEKEIGLCHTNQARV